MRYLIFILLVACGPATPVGTTDAGPCTDAKPEGIAVIGPSGTAQPPACLDGQTGVWVALRYAADFHPGTDFSSVGATVNLGNTSSGSFTKTSDFVSDRQTPSAADLATNIWINLAGQEGVTHCQVRVWSFDGSTYLGHDLPVEEITAGVVKHFDIQLGKH